MLKFLDSLFNILSNIFEKYLISALCAIAIMIIILYFTPEDYIVYQRLGRTFYLILVFVISFLIIELVVFVCSNVEKNLKDKIKNRKYVEEHNKEIIEQNKEFVDRLKSNERKLLEYFLENNNNEAIILGEHWDNQVLSALCNKNEIITENETEVIDVNTLEKTKIKRGWRVNRYKLKAEIYNDLKRMKDNNIEISNFDMK